MTIEIKLIEEDFINSIYGDVYYCPIARAVKREYNINKVAVGVDNIYDQDFKTLYIIQGGFSGFDYKNIMENKEKYLPYTVKLTVVEPIENKI